MGNEGNSRLRRRSVVGFASLVMLLTAASAAWACTTVVGTTWYSDNTWSKSGSSGTAVTIKANGAMFNTDYYMISGKTDANQCPCIDQWVKENSNTITSSGSGALANTSGTIDRDPDTWHVCFVTTDIDSGHPTSVTDPVYFQVL